VELVAGFTVGILGSVHCIGMCGPIALVLPDAKRAGAHYLFGRLIYNAGRVLTYAALGLAVGFLGRRIALAGFQQTLTIVLGAAVLTAALLPAAGARLAARWSPLGRAHQWLSTGLGTLLRRRSLASLGLIGLLNGLLPCGLVYLALAGAAATADEIRAMFFMVGFGGGTFPAMLAVSLAGSVVPLRWRRRLTRLLPAVMALVGILLILRGLDLGIPFVSPRLSASATMGGSTSSH
jgi:sulfite exporter TauE/SafE